MTPTAEKQKPRFPLTEIVLAVLAKGSDEALEITDEGEEILLFALDTLFEAGYPVKKELEELVVLTHLLATDKRSPGAADRILAILKTDDRVTAALGRQAAQSTSRLANSRLAKFAGAEAGPRAPAVGQAAPTGAVKLSSLMPGPGTSRR